jgi:hypothetical protein
MRLKRASFSLSKPSCCSSNRAGGYNPVGYHYSAEFTTRHLPPTERAGEVDPRFVKLPGSRTIAEKLADEKPYVQAGICRSPLKCQAIRHSFARTGEFHTDGPISMVVLAWADLDPA